MMSSEEEKKEGAEEEKEIIPYAKLPNDAKFPEKLEFTPEAAELVKRAKGRGSLHYRDHENGEIVVIEEVNIGLLYYINYKDGSFEQPSEMMI